MVMNLVMIMIMIITTREDEHSTLLAAQGPRSRAAWDSTSQSASRQSRSHPPRVSRCTPNES